MIAILSFRLRKGCNLGSFYSAKKLAEYWKHFVARFNDVHASGYNSAGSERIWMKFGYSTYILWIWP